MTWADVKAKLESQGVKDSDLVREADIYFSTDHPYFTHWRLAPAPERTRAVVQEA